MKTNTNQIPNALLIMDYKGYTIHHIHDDIEKIAALIEPNSPRSKSGTIWHTGNLIRMYWDDDNGESAHCVYSFSDEIFTYLQDTFWPLDGKKLTEEENAIANDTHEWKSFLQLARDVLGGSIDTETAYMTMCTPDVCIHKDKSGWSWSS